ncbi:organic solute transporter subunit beta isoform X2 [Protopterus annectens]|uniref:organic solute transporter subunit beta isoform X2 n=1 Tax=Protopterus annectens TaxID=7888 RepID=UPI001CFB4B69|nr:organic solute transporter subunit beta isoform X2 [Protopterus annectens]
MKLIWITLFMVLQAMPEGATSKPGATSSSFAASPEGNLRMSTSTNKTQGMSSAQLTQLLWFFRAEDPTKWNYSILGLALVALLCGLLVLGCNIMGNKKRKAILQHQAATQTQIPNKSTGHPETKQALLSLRDNESLNSSNEQTKWTHPFPDSEPRPGDIVVQWKDGNTTTLFKDGTEHEAK